MLDTFLEFGHYIHLIIGHLHPKIPAFKISTKLSFNLRKNMSLCKNLSVREEK